MAQESPTGGERTEEPSSKRREDFRKKGQVAQSKEVQTAALLTICLLFWLMYLPIFWKSFTELIYSLWLAIGEYQITETSIISLTAFIFQKIALLLAPLFFLVMLISFFSSFFQFGWLLSSTPLIPDFGKLDPIAGMARFFSKKALIELIKSLLKLILIGWIAYSTVIDHFNEALILVDTNIGSIFSYIAKISALIMAKICAILILLAFLDFIFIKWDMEEQMKMTKEELKEEFKESEGDPHIKAQIRAIQQEMARKRMMAEVPKADVVVTNPTHLAIAIRYNAKEMDAPLVVAKGADLLAMKIREIALEHKVPIFENPPVARLLHKLDLGEHIPEDLFKAIAEILAHVYSLKGKIR
ncbi:MAG: flagellar biosynthesis protein FlhB [Proteobacteria bacterium]|nr:flagellar biosynthesis protein FlhB [Pseudomonadota bacterium]